MYNDEYFFNLIYYPCTDLVGLSFTFKNKYRILISIFCNKIFNLSMRDLNKWIFYKIQVLQLLEQKKFRSYFNLIILTSRYKINWYRFVFKYRYFTYKFNKATEVNLYERYTHLWNSEAELSFIQYLSVFFHYGVFIFDSRGKNFVNCFNIECVYLNSRYPDLHTFQNCTFWEWNLF